MKRPDFFKVSKKEILCYLLSSRSSAWPVWILAIIGFVFLVIGVFFEWRFFVAGLIVIFTLIPTVMFFIFYSHMLDNQMIANLLPHTVEPHQGGYLVRIYRKVSSEGKDDDEEDEWVETRRMTIFDSAVRKRSDIGGFTVLDLVDSPVKVLYIPRGMMPIADFCEIKDDSYMSLAANHEPLAHQNET